MNDFGLDNLELNSNYNSYTYDIPNNFHVNSNYLNYIKEYWRFNTDVPVSRGLEVDFPNNGGINCSNEDVDKNSDVNNNVSSYLEESLPSSYQSPYNDNNNFSNVTCKSNFDDNDLPNNSNLSLLNVYYDYRNDSSELSSYNDENCILNKNPFAIPDGDSDVNNNICIDSEEDLGNNGEILLFDVSISNVSFKRKTYDFSRNDIKRYKRGKNEPVYIIDSYLRDYPDYDDIPVTNCVCKNPVQAYMEKNKYINMVFYETHCYTRPSILIGKTCVRCVEFRDNDSFMYCVKYSYYCTKNYKKDTRADYLEEQEKKALCKGDKVVNFSSLKFPVSPLDNERISRFEEDNNIGVVIFGIENEKFVVLRRSGNEKENVEKYIFLMYVKCTDKCGMYLNVTNPKSILAEIYNDGKKLKNYTFCNSCLSVFRNKNTLDNHICDYFVSRNRI